ncbi:hypothetical protein [Pararobbsia alpina]|uniref:Uncharacterized protein n=1 Tax=Pararobbsia alpina TaxID=621374 RepID=A0A6S7DCA3_9BURK|nr:hypothetical protein [Pararobbsia alpina]CAB3801424.1 hypothetical protein LMG28138_05011 [Pararobbsia alpina]
MGIQEDKEDLNRTGIRGVVRELRQNRQTAYIRELDGGWRGEVVSDKPALGTGPYLYVAVGEPVLRFENNKIDEQPTEYCAYV